ncbi:MAG: hypothetical protein PVH82_11100, partial [Desulfobacteraceae bacterium]
FLLVMIIMVDPTLKHYFCLFNEIHSTSLLVPPGYITSRGHKSGQKRENCGYPFFVQYIFEARTRGIEKDSPGLPDSALSLTRS